ncbi:MAG TPA: Smr/MutS family protein [Terriglobales bacterium]|nr:Smr/MutS family protein [Terriglobales bacterium]
MREQRWHELDLHGERLDRGRVGYRLREALRAAARERAGLRVIHGRGQHVLAELVQSVLREWELEHAEGWANPGETRVEAAAVARFGQRGSSFR